MAPLQDSNPILLSYTGEGTTATSYLGAHYSSLELVEDSRFLRHLRLLEVVLFQRDRNLRTGVESHWLPRQQVESQSLWLEQIIHQNYLGRLSSYITDRNLPGAI